MQPQQDNNAWATLCNFFFISAAVGEIPGVSLELQTGFHQSEGAPDKQEMLRNSSFGSAASGDSPRELL